MSLGVVSAALVRLNARGGVRAQLRRPAFSRVSDLRVQYLPCGEIATNRDAIASHI